MAYSKERIMLLNILWKFGAYKVIQKDSRRITFNFEPLNLLQATDRVVTDSTLPELIECRPAPLRKLQSAFVNMFLNASVSKFDFLLAIIYRHVPGLTLLLR